MSFSKFARMPEPERRLHDVLRLVRDAVALQKTALDPVDLNAELPDGRFEIEIDPTMISQAMINLIKNAGEAIDSLQEKGAPDGYRPEIRVTSEQTDRVVIFRIMDNGIGLPPDRAKLFEPYVTTRAKGTGLGLPIVKKIIEEHGGTLALEDAPAFAKGARRGAMAVVTLPTGVERTEPRKRHVA